MRASTLVAGAAERGLVRSDPLGLGVDVDAECRVIGSNGKPSARISALGPLTAGRFWEIMAVPEIRAQTAAVADRIVRSSAASAVPTRGTLYRAAV